MVSLNLPSTYLRPLWGHENKQNHRSEKHKLSLVPSPPPQLSSLVSTRLHKYTPPLASAMGRGIVVIVWRRAWADQNFDLYGVGVNSMPCFGEKLHWFLFLKLYCWASVEGGAHKHFIGVCIRYSCISKVHESPARKSSPIQHFDTEL